MNVPVNKSRVANMVDAISRPWMLRDYMVARFLKKPLFDQTPSNPELRTCYEALKDSYNSYTIAAIQELDPLFQNSTVILLVLGYLVYFVALNDELDYMKKLQLLQAIQKLDNTHNGAVLTNDLQVLPSVTDQLAALDEEHRQIIQKTITSLCSKLYLKNKTMRGSDKVSEAIAIEISHGLTQLFAADVDSVRLSKHFGILLSKCAAMNNRRFWPKSIWSSYTNDLYHFSSKENLQKCTSHIIANALQHLPNALIYLMKLPEQSSFQLCSLLLLTGLAQLHCFSCYGANAALHTTTLAHLSIQARTMSRCMALTEYYIQQLQICTPGKQLDKIFDSIANLHSNFSHNTPPYSKWQKLLSNNVKEHRLSLDKDADINTQIELNNFYMLLSIIPTVVLSLAYVMSIMPELKSVN